MIKQNRITAAILKLEQRIQALALPPEKLETLSRNLDMEFDEYCAFQEMKSCASTDGTLTLEEAQLIYSYLGNIPDQFNRQPVAVKTVLTQIYAELIQRRIKSKSKVATSQQ